VLLDLAAPKDESFAVVLTMRRDYYNLCSSGTISGVAAVYQRHDFLTERKDALDRWGAHVTELVRNLRAGDQLIRPNA